MDIGTDVVLYTDANDLRDQIHLGVLELTGLAVKYFGKLSKFHKTKINEGSTYHSKS